MSNAHVYFRERIKEIAQLQKEIDKWLMLSSEWRTGICHNRLLKEYMELTYSSEELIDLVSEKWDKFHNSRYILRAIDQIISKMGIERQSATLLFTGRWGKHVARKYHIPKDKPYGLKVSVQYISYFCKRLKIHNIIGDDHMSDMRCIPDKDVFCVITRIQVDGKEIRDEETIPYWRSSYENA